MSNGKSNKVASRVFGRNVFNELDTSLCYTPSPGSSKKSTNLVESQTKINSSIFTSILEEGESTSQSTPAPTVLFLSDRSTDHASAANMTLEKRVSFAQDGKENMNDSVIRVASESLNSIRSAELNRLRASKKKSPMRRNLVKMTEAAIDDATTSLKSSTSKKKNHPVSSSVFQSVNAGRTARLKVLRQKAKATKSVSFRWDQENTKSKSLQKTVEENRRQIRAIQRKITSNHFKDKARQDDAKKMERLAEIEKEYMFKSTVFQEHQQTLKLGRDKNRKMSIDARTKIRRNKREAEEVLRIRKLDEDHAMFEVRADLHKSRMEAKEANAEKRRMSFQFRAGDARRIRDIRSEWKENIVSEKHIGHELERAAARDVESYKKQMKKESRDDLKKRNMEARDSRKREKDKAYEAMMAEHRSYELKWEGERDAEAYRKRMQEERRKSLACRNKESERHAKVMEELRNIANDKEAQSFMLKFSAENDAKEYIAKVAEERRKSLKLRGKEARKRRQYEEEEQSKAIEYGLIEGALQSDCQRDIEKYKTECAERRRKSFQYRGKQVQLQRLEEEERRLEQMQKNEESFKLDSLAQKDVEDYYKDCRKGRRKSLALRAKEMRQHVEWKNRRAQMKLEERAHTTHLNSMDIHHIALERERERARMAMDALRNAGCNWKGNPFGDLINDL